MYSSQSITDSSESRPEYFIHERTHSESEAFKSNDIFNSPTSCLTRNLDLFNDIGSATPKCKRSAFIDISDYSTPVKSLKSFSMGVSEIQSDNLNAECPGAPKKSVPRKSRISSKGMKSIHRPLNFDEVAFSSVRVV